MCGIVGALVRSNTIVSVLLEGLKLLEYRGYDSSGIAVLQETSPPTLAQVRTLGKVSQLESVLKPQSLTGKVGIGHTRWATHGKPSEQNAHPHLSNNEVALVHNGIVENFEPLKAALIKQGYTFQSQTDTEVIVHLIHQCFKAHKDLRRAVQEATRLLKGTFALGVVHADTPDHLLGYCAGSPLVVGVGSDGYFMASDPIALFPVSDHFICLQEHDLVDITPNGFTIYDKNNEPVERPSHPMDSRYKEAGRGQYRHYMLKEIFEQPTAIYNTLASYIDQKDLFASPSEAGRDGHFLQQVEHLHIVACGTSHHAAMVARYWIESLTGLSCQTDIASEYRYRDVVVPPNTLFITLSQSGETADTLAALRKAKQLNYLSTLGICNVPNSVLARESDHLLMTKAGPEIGVASTKAFTTQLVIFLLIVQAISVQKKQANVRLKLSDRVQSWLATLPNDLRQLPHYTEQVLQLEPTIKALATHIADKHHVLFLGRETLYPIAKEGALKLKEISYIHAEAYPAGELKHGPIALIDGHIPTILLMPYNALFEKAKSTLNEIAARGGELVVLTDRVSKLEGHGVSHLHLVGMPSVPVLLSPIIYSIVLQLLAYHVAVLKGTDVDQPRNLAKSVTVE